jgi:DNA-directed RNA polymerase subunit alpha
MLKMELAKPKITITESTGQRSAKFILEPLERGYGTTIGNMIRRISLGNLPGTAVTAIRINGVNNEFSTIKGVAEDVTDIVLNVKSLILKTVTDDPGYTSTMRIYKKNAGIIRAADIEHESAIEICNPDLIIATLDSNVDFKMELSVAKGRGYVIAKDQKGATDSIGYIAVDSLYSPVVKCNYYVEPSRVGSDMNFDKLTVELTTNGSVDAKDIVALSAKLMQEHLMLMINMVNGMSDQNIFIESKEEIVEKIFETSIEDMELSPRSANCLNRANIKTIRDLTSKTREDMLRVRNLGSKSLDEIISKLASLGLSLKIEEEVQF